MANDKQTAKRILDYLETHPNLDARELGYAFKMSRDTMRKNYINPLHKDRLIYISGYRVEPAHQIELFSVGDCDDVQKVLVGKKSRRKPAKPKVIPKKAQIVNIPRPEIDPLTAFALGLAA